MMHRRIAFIMLFQNQYKRVELLWVKIKDKALYNSTTADIATHN